MRGELVGLLWRTAVTTGTMVVLALACGLADLVVPLPVPVAAGIILGAVWWYLHVGGDRAEHARLPALDLDADYALPHAQDMRVRRLEDMVHGAQPSRRMTSRGLALVLAEIAEERARDPDAPPPGPELSRLLRTARTEDASVPPIDRPTLHRILDELAVREERH